MFQHEKHGRSETEPRFLIHLPSIADDLRHEEARCHFCRSHGVSQAKPGQACRGAVTATRQTGGRGAGRRTRRQGRGRQSGQGPEESWHLSAACAEGSHRQPGTATGHTSVFCSSWLASESKSPLPKCTRMPPAHPNNSKALQYPLARGRGQGGGWMYSKQDPERQRRVIPVVLPSETEVVVKNGLFFSIKATASSFLHAAASAQLC